MTDIRGRIKKERKYLEEQALEQYFDKLKKEQLKEPLEVILAVVVKFGYIDKSLQILDSKLKECDESAKKIEQVKTRIDEFKSRFNRIAISVDGISVFI